MPRMPKDPLAPKPGKRLGQGATPPGRRMGQTMRATPPVPGTNPAMRATRAVRATPAVPGVSPAVRATRAVPAMPRPKMGPQGPMPPGMALPPTAKKPKKGPYS